MKADPRHSLELMRICINASAELVTAMAEAESYGADFSSVENERMNLAAAIVLVRDDMEKKYE